MTWQKEVDELKQRLELVKQMGGKEKVGQQHSKGRLTARERIDSFLDERTFREIGAFASEPEYDEHADLKSFLPSSLIIGYGQTDNRNVCILANDFTVKGGSSDWNAINKHDYIARMALQRKMPLVCLYEGGGGRVSEGGERTITPINSGWAALTELMGEAPVVAANLGTAAGWIAVMVGFSHFSVMAKNSELFVAGPPLVKPALGYDITKQELGNYRVHVYESGVVDNLGEDEEDCFRQIERFLSYMPQNVWHSPPYTGCSRRSNYHSTAEHRLVSVPRL
ncbi:carboxyl transferase domain-containing protein [Thermodesulfobacteriota bacterium]